MSFTFILYFHFSLCKKLDQVSSLCKIPIRIISLEGCPPSLFALSAVFVLSKFKLVCFKTPHNSDKSAKCFFLHNAKPEQFEKKTVHQRNSQEESRFELSGDNLRWHKTGRNQKTRREKRVPITEEEDLYILWWSVQERGKTRHTGIYRNHPRKRTKKHSQTTFTPTFLRKNLVCFPLTMFSESHSHKNAHPRIWWPNFGQNVCIVLGDYGTLCAPGRSPPVNVNLANWCKGIKRGFDSPVRILH